jgi:hypothetical protein
MLSTFAEGINDFCFDKTNECCTLAGLQEGLAAFCCI